MNEVRTAQDFLGLSNTEKINYINGLYNEIKKEKAAKEEALRQLETLDGAYKVTLKENIKYGNEILEIKKLLKPYNEWKDKVGNRKGNSKYKESIIMLAGQGCCKADIMKTLNCSQPTVDKWFPKDGPKGKPGRHKK